MTTTEFKLDLEALLSIVRGLRNGIVYGAKIRFPHAFVMTFLFRDGTIEDKLRAIFKATFQHAKNLGLFAVIFKTIRILLRWLRQSDDGFNTFIAGLVGGYFRFGTNDPITSQINMYIMSRVIFGLANGLVRSEIVQYSPHTYSAFGSIIWGLVMTLFFHHRGLLQRSMEQSMQYIYVDSDNIPTLPTDYMGVFNWLYQGVPEGKP
jgi:peroxisomal membrane protein 4